MDNPETILKAPETQLRVVFDGDAVLFSDESERVFSKGKLMAYLEHEKRKVDVPMNEVWIVTNSAISHFFTFLSLQ